MPPLANVATAKCKPRQACLVAKVFCRIVEDALAWPPSP